MTQPLPSRPSLEHLKNQAKTLLQAARRWRSCVSIAWRETCRNIVRRMRRLQRAAKTLSRSSCRMHNRLWPTDTGFANWTLLKQHVDEQTLAAHTRSEQIASLIQYCLDGELPRAERCLARHPELATADIFMAATSGDAACVEAMLESNPTLVNLPGGPLHAPPLVYVCSSRFASPSHAPTAVRTIVHLLLDRGADPNAHWLTRHLTMRRCPHFTARVV